MIVHDMIEHQIGSQNASCSHPHHYPWLLNYSILQFTGAILDTHEGAIIPSIFCYLLYFISGDPWEKRGVGVGEFSSETDDCELRAGQVTAYPKDRGH